MNEEMIIVFESDSGEEKILNAVYEVCGRCAGKGSHVNPAIDGHGISAQEFAEDPDFKEAYFRGDYDVPCYECKGKRVVLVVDPVNNSPEDLKEYQEKLEWDRYYDSVSAAERSMGA